MGSVFRKTATKTLPKGAEIVVRKKKRGKREGGEGKDDMERFARWKDRHGKDRQAKITTGKNREDRIVVEAKTFTAKYRSASGRVVERATGCRDETMARRKLSEFMMQEERIITGIISSAEAETIEHQDEPLEGHVNAYLEALTASDAVEATVKNAKQRLNDVSGDCRWRTLRDMRAEDLVKWLNERKKEGMSAGARNGYRQACVGFGNWCVREKRLTTNPFSTVPKADQKVDCQRKFRALNEAEIAQLLEVTRERPLLARMTVTRGKNKGKLLVNLREETKERLRRLGRERALVFKTFLLTGLRRGELASVTVGQLVLDARMPHISLAAADEKNREGNDIPLRQDLASDIREWVTDKLRTSQQAARSRGESIPERLPADTPLMCIIFCFAPIHR